MSNHVNTGQVPWWDIRNKVSNKRKTKVTDSKSYSSYWMDDDSYDYFYDKKSTQNTKIKIDGFGKSAAVVDLSQAHRLASVRRAVANFVRILTNDDEIKVVFNSGHDSYTDGKTIVISAEHDPKKFDVLVGTSLHEAGHCLLSGPLLKMLSDGSFMRIVQNKFGSNPSDEEYVQTIVNFLEDRRIDAEVYRRAPGYRPYYQAMYDKYWNAKEIAKSLIRDENINSPTKRAYQFRLINLTNPATKYTLDRLPGFDKIYKLVGLKNILRLSDENGVVNEKRIVNLACEIYQIIIDNYVEEDAQPPSPSDYQDADYQDGDGDGEDDQINSNLGNHDFSGDDESGQSQMSQDDIENAVAEEIGTKLGKGQTKTDKVEQQVKQHLNGDNKKKKLSKKMNNVVKTMEESEITVSNVMIEGQSYPYVRVPRLTTSSKYLLPRDIIAGGRGWKTSNEEYVKRGRRLGQIIVDRIKIRHDNNETKFSRRPVGRIDRRLLHSLGTDNENVFFTKIIQDYKDSIIYLTIDCSSSMYGTKWEQSVVLATGLAYAAKKINNFNIVVNLRYGLDSIWSVNMFDSRTEPFSHFERWMKKFVPSSTTPESIVYEIEEKFVEQLKTKDNNVYFITMTDGGPNYTPAGVSRTYYAPSGFGSDTAHRHCRQVLKRFREIGVEVLSYYIGSNGIYNREYEINAFKKSYGKDGVFVPVENFSMVSKSLNDLLIRSATR